MSISTAYRSAQSTVSSANQNSEITMSGVDVDLEEEWWWKGQNIDQ
jgi:hypothetical protein